MPLSAPLDHRSYRSADSNASEKSYLPVSLGLCKSGDSNHTIDDSQELCDYIREYCKLHPFSEEKDRKIQSTKADVEASPPACSYEKPALQGADAEAAASVDRMDSATSQRSIDDPEEAKRFYQEMMHKHPVQGVTLKADAPAPDPALTELRVDPMLGRAVTFLEMCVCYTRARQQWSESELRRYWLTLPLVEQTQQWMAVGGYEQQALSFLGGPPSTPAVVSLGPDATCRKRRMDCIPKTLSQKRCNRSAKTEQREQDHEVHVTGGVVDGEDENEETWENRIKKRLEGLTNLKEKDFYIKNQDVSGSKRPLTPDPRDTTLSKRGWERKIAECRSSWRSIDGVRELVKMGFEEQRAARAWRQAGEDIEKAASILRVQRLVAMGFQKQKAVAALKQTQDDMDAAANILLAQ